MRRVVVRIDNLVLKGFRNGEQRAIARGLREQLTSVLSTPEVAKKLGSLRTVRRIDGGSVDIRAGEAPQWIGAAVARRIGKGIGL